MGSSTSLKIFCSQLAMLLRYVCPITYWLNDYLFFKPRQGYDTFSLSEVQEIDAIVSSFDVLENKESGPLILAWAVFLCLISSLPEKEENNILMVCCAHICVIDLLVLYQEAVSFDITLDVLMLSQEIDHIGYVRQAFEAGSLTSFLEIIENDILRDFDVSE